MEFKMDTPEDIESMTMPEIAEHIVNLDPDACSTVKKVNIITTLAKALNLSVDKRLILGLASQPQVTLLNACPGAGKTTMTNLKAYALKHFHRSRSNPEQLTDGNHILFLVYNDKNVGSTADRHKSMGTRLNAALTASIKNPAERAKVQKDTTLNVKTMHSFCKMWTTKYSIASGLCGRNQMDPNLVINLMLKCTEGVLKKHAIKDAEFKSKDYSKKLSTLYNLQRECLIPNEEIDSIPSFLELELSKEIVLEIFELYDKMKANRRSYDFTDMIVHFYQMIKDHPDILREIAICYDFMIADETQDFTPIMFKILRLLVDTGLQLMCLCDEDQTIYDFRGASVYNILKFREMFPECRIYDLSINRRCRRAIYEESLKIIRLNQLRFNKQIRCVKEGGSVRYVPYTTETGQLNSLLVELKKMTPQELDSTAIGYRNHEQALAIMECLQREDIPFHINSGTEIFETELYKHVLGVLNLLLAPYDQVNHLHLYKLLPVQRSEIYDVIGYDEKKKIFKDVKSIHFSQYDYGKLMTRSGFASAMSELETLSREILHQPIREIVGRVWKLFTAYFWNFRRQTLGQDDVYKMIETDLMLMLDSDEAYPQYYKQLMTKIDKYRAYNQRSIGVELSTFHKLKGLEYSNVYLLYLDDNIFPNFERIEHLNLPLSTIESLKESEIRLYYVAVTRAIDNLVIYYNKNNPSELVTRVHEDFKPKRMEQRIDPYGIINSSAPFDEPLPSASTPVLLPDDDDDDDDDYDDLFAGLPTSASMVQKVEEQEKSQEETKKVELELSLADQVSLMEELPNKSNRLARLLQTM